MSLDGEYGLQPKQRNNTTDTYGDAPGYGENRPSAKLRPQSAQLQKFVRGIRFPGPWFKLKEWLLTSLQPRPPLPILRISATL